MQDLIIPSERIAGKIYIIRNKKVMLDRDLAELYGVQTKVLNQAVKRNIKRFPPDFMFQLNKQEMENWKSQIVMSNLDENSLRSQFVTLKGRGKHPKYLPLAFTEQGVAMLASVLNSDRAIQVNIQIVRTFTKLRELLATNEELQRKITQMEQKYDSKLKEVFNLLRLLVEKGDKPGGEIGFKYKKIK
ncbi:MAG: ORF6N domain-containing protein [bacterium]